MVAKLKSSFLKNSFQLFCSKINNTSHHNLNSNSSAAPLNQRHKHQNDNTSRSNSNGINNNKQKGNSVLKDDSFIENNSNNSSKNKKNGRSSSAFSTSDSSSKIDFLKKSESFHSDPNKPHIAAIQTLTSPTSLASNIDTATGNTESNRSKSNTIKEKIENNSGSNSNNVNMRKHRSKSTSNPNYFEPNPNRYSYPTKLINSKEMQQDDYYEINGASNSLTPSIDLDIKSIAPQTTIELNTNTNSISSTNSSSSSSSPSSVSSSSNFVTSVNTNSISTLTNRNTKSSLYSKNTKSIAELKLAKKLQLMKQNEANLNNNNNNNNNNINYNINLANAQSQANSTPMSGILSRNSLLINSHNSNNNKNFNNEINKKTNGDFLTRLNGHLFMKSSSNVNATGNESTHDRRINMTTSHKKVVRFADSLGLELENIITLNNSSDTSISSKRRYRLNPNQQISQSKQQPQQHQQSIPNNANISRINQFECENSNDTCLYDDIINQIALGTDNRSRYSSHCQTMQNKVSKPIYFNEPLVDSNNNYNNNNNNNNNSSHNNINNSKRYVLPSPSQQHYLNNNVSESAAELNKMVHSWSNKNSTNLQNAQNQSVSSSNITTITTRLNNGKLESEV
jgi:hypothetical protein